MMKCGSIVMAISYWVPLRSTLAQVERLAKHGDGGMSPNVEGMESISRFAARSAVRRHGVTARVACLLGMMLIGTPGALGQFTEMPSSRAPSHGIGAVERAVTSLVPGEREWVLASVLGVPERQGPLRLPAPVPGEPLQIGVNARPPGGPIEARTSGIMSLDGADLVWRIRVDAPRAAALRLRLTNLDLGQGASIIVAGSGQGYVVRGRGALSSGTEWSPVLDGEHGFVEYRGPVSLGVPRFIIDEVAEIAWPMTGVGDVLPCHVDVQCETVDTTARDAVGRMIYSTPFGTFVCTGALLNDSNAATTIGWFLTANRCISTQVAADSLSVYWFYQTPACGGAVPELSTLPVSQGATLMTTAPASGASLLKLAQDPSQGQGLAAWTTAEPTGTVAAIHHPSGEFKRIARGSATLVPPICDGALGYYQYHYIDYTSGITESGSTGAPLFDSAWRIVGQLSAVCALTDPTCENPNQWNSVYGRFSRTLPIVCSFLTDVVSPARIYVDASATGAGTGLSWENAVTSLATAMAGLCPPVGGVEVWVANGTYTPSGGSRESAFQMVPGVAMYGGFAGGELLLSERNFATNVAILSGDLAGDDGPGFVNRTENARHVVRGTGVGSSSILDGFTIRGGNADGESAFNDKGGGVYLEAGSPRIRNCIYEDNQALYSGGGMALFIFGQLDVADCTFRGNRAYTGGAIGLFTAGGTVTSCVLEFNSATNDGGAIKLYESSAQIAECMFIQNTAIDRGGGVSAFVSPLATVMDCRFDRNAAGLGGGAVFAAWGASTLLRCDFVGNTTDHFGGAVLHESGAQTAIQACRFLGNVAGEEGGAVHLNSGSVSMVNSEFSGNTSGEVGGAYWHNKGCQGTILNCTFWGNSALWSAGGAGFEGGTATVTNSVLWGNSVSGAGGQDSQVRLLAGATAAVTYSLIEGLTGSLGGQGNIGGNPLFVSPLGVDQTAGTEDDNLALGEGSPARDAGNSSAVAGFATDVRGGARRVDDSCVADTGTGPTPIVDMGAIEGGPCTCYVNCDGSTGNPRLTANDFQCFINEYVAATAYANCDGSTVQPVLNANDFQCFINAYANGCP